MTVHKEPFGRLQRVVTKEESEQLITLTKAHRSPTEKG